MLEQKLLKSASSIDALNKSLQELNLAGEWIIASSINDDDDTCNFDLKLTIIAEDGLTMLRIIKTINILNHKSQKLNNLLQV